MDNGIYVFMMHIFSYLHIVRANSIVYLIIVCPVIFPVPIFT
jgi:hypothetical protein